jgi:hypothetical protein
MKKRRNYSLQLKVIGAIIAIIALSFGFQILLASEPSPAPTALVIAEPDIGTLVQDASAPSEKPVPIAIIYPEKSSMQAHGFSIRISVSGDKITCYYRTDDAGRLTWDRRKKPCLIDMPITSDMCNTKGANTCKVYVEAADANGNTIGSDTAYFGLQ